MSRWIVTFILSAACPATVLAQEQGAPYSTSEIDAYVIADVDKDGVLNQAEFKTFVQEMAKTGQSTARQIRFFGAYGFAFSITDVDDNNIVTPEELRSADDDHRGGTGPASQ